MNIATGLLAPVARAQESRKSGSSMAEKRLAQSSLFIILLILAACTTEQEVNATFDASSPAAAPAVYAPQAQAAPTDGQVSRMTGLNDFGFRVLRAVQEDGKSMVFSPLSLTYAMGMAAMGAGDEALADLNGLIGLEADDRTTLPDLCATLMNYLPTADDQVSLNVANAFYLNAMRTDLQLNPTYRQAIIDIYDADCEQLDFSRSASLARINDWCNRQTCGFLPEVLKTLDPMAVCYLLNALYFKADWLLPFISELTEEADFRCEDGRTTRVPLMRKEEFGSYPYADDGLCEAVRLDYGWYGKYAMTILLPKEGHATADVIDALTGERWVVLDKTLRSDKSRRDVDVLIPSFETEVTTQLVEPLEALGLASWFDGPAFPGIAQFVDGTPDWLFVSNVFQKARIQVNEKGTEAAAVTVIEMKESAIMEPHDLVTFRADHPFVYLITEQRSGAVLFVGTYHGERKGMSGGDATGIRDLQAG